MGCRSSKTDSSAKAEFDRAAGHHPAAGPNDCDGGARSHELEMSPESRRAGPPPSFAQHLLEMSPFGDNMFIRSAGDNKDNSPSEDIKSFYSSDQLKTFCSPGICLYTTSNIWSSIIYSTSDLSLSATIMMHAYWQKVTSSYMRMYGAICVRCAK
jgi:hypothetical protein